MRLRSLFGIKEAYLGLLLVFGYLTLIGYTLALGAFGVISLSCVWGGRA